MATFATMDMLQEWREREKLSIPAAAKRVGVSRETWWRWENNQRAIGLPSIPAIERETGIPREQIRPDIYERGGA